MSKNKKKYQKQKQGNNPPWLIAILGGIVLIVVALLLANRNGASRGGTPSIAVDQQKIDLGTQKFGTNESFTIKVTNTGTGTLRFKEQPYIEVLEGC